MINSQLLLYLNLGIGLLLVLYFVLGRPKAKQPTRLNMRAKDSVEKTPVVLEPELKKELIAMPAEPREVYPEQIKESRSLSIMFMYNGHDFEAHQVLGIPQGASMHQATEVYQNLVKTSDTRSLQLYESAYSAISLRHRKHRL